MKKYIGTIMQNIRKKKNISQVQLAEQLTNYDIYVKNGAISAWEKNATTPTAYQFLAICEILGISDINSEFIGESENNPYSKLNEKGKEKVDEYIKLLLLSDEFSKKESEVIPFSRMMPVSLLKTSAGVGNFLDEENFETVEITEQIPDRATFGVYVDGDSMEPRIHDGQLIWIQQTESILSGELGLFYLNGKTYVKKFKSTPNETTLISLNEKYEPKPVLVDDDFKIFGRVLL